MFPEMLSIRLLMTRNAIIRSRVTQDRRKNARLMTFLACQFTFEGTSYKAVILDLSLKGAFISSPFLPPKGGTIAITLETPHLEEPLKLEGEVVRGTWGMSDHGRLGRFGVRFNHSSLKLIQLINRLSSSGAIRFATEKPRPIQP